MEKMVEFVLNFEMNLSEWVVRILITNLITTFTYVSTVKICTFKYYLCKFEIRLKN